MIARRLRLLRHVIVCFVIAALSPSGRAEIITFEFRGTVSSTSGLTPQPGWPAVGSTFQGTYRFNSNAVDSEAQPSQGIYTTLAPNGDINVAVADFRWFAPASAVLTIDSPPGAGSDTYEVGEYLGMSLTSHPQVAATLDRWNFRLHMVGNGDLLNGPDLPVIPPPLDHTTQKLLALYGDSTSNLSPDPLVTIVASLDSLQVVPEPSAAVVSATMMSRLLLSRRWRRRNAFRRRLDACAVSSRQ